MSVDSFSRQVSALAARLSHLFNLADTAAPLQHGIASDVFKELGVASEELQVSLEELQQQNEELAIALESVAFERKRYEDLFHFAPQAYLVTDLNGCIQEANTMAAQLVGVSAQHLIGKPLAVYISEDNRSLFRAELLRRQQQRDYFQEWELRLKARNQEIFDVSCVTLAIRDRNNAPIGFRWTLRTVVQQRQGSAEQNGQESQEKLIIQDRHLHTFSRGDIISLNPQTLWYVTEGVVKLTTLTEQGQEVLIGIVRPGIPFGAYLTALAIHQATALSEVKLVALTLEEISVSAYLAEVLFAKAIQRLRQTEILLSISGERRVGNRLYRLLHFLKEEIGEPIEQGTRLRVRLTHEEIATACCTTRVTTTRLLNRLQQQGKIAFDNKSHIILLDDS